MQHFDDSPRMPHRPQSLTEIVKAIREEHPEIRTTSIVLGFILGLVVLALIAVAQAALVGLAIMIAGSIARDAGIIDSGISFFHSTLLGFVLLVLTRMMR